MDLRLVLVLQMLLLGLGEAKRRIVGGTDANEKEFPFSVSIRRTEMEEMFGYGNHICGGALIDNQTVVTAAHCVFDKFGNFLGNPNSYTIVVGSIYRSFQDTHEQVRKSQQIFVHPEYSMYTMYNDVAVIILDEPISLYGEYTNTIPLTKKSFPEGTDCIVNGWGHMKLKGIPGKFIAEVLQKANVSILSHQECALNYTAENYTLWDKQICVGVIGQEIDSCQGDSGGPLTCDGVLVGLVSTGSGCAKPGFPGIYTDVSQYLDFIQNPEKFKAALKAEVIKITGRAANSSSALINSTALMLLGLFFLLSYSNK